MTDTSEPEAPAPPAAAPSEAAPPAAAAASEVAPPAAPPRAEWRPIGALHAHPSQSWPRWEEMLGIGPATGFSGAPGTPPGIAGVQ